MYRDFPLVQIHPSALLASHVGQCSAAQASFWPMHERLFAGAGAGEWGGGPADDLPTFLAYARELGMDSDKLQQCIANNTFAPQIEADYRAAEASGVRSTPSFLVNGKLVVGAQPFDVWKSTLDDLLERQ